jgi:hypothetical protein
LWRRGTRRPDELNVVKIVRSRSDAPIAMLHLAGYRDMADLLKGTMACGPVEFDIRRPHLVGLQKIIKQALEVQKG